MNGIICLIAWYSVLKISFLLWFLVTDLRLTSRWLIKKINLTYVHYGLVPHKSDLPDGPGHRCPCFWTPRLSSQTTPCPSARTTRCQGPACAWIWTWSPCVASPADLEVQMEYKYKRELEVPRFFYFGHEVVWFYLLYLIAKQKGKLNLVILFRSNYVQLTKNPDVLSKRHLNRTVNDLSNRWEFSGSKISCKYTNSVLLYWSIILE